MTMEAVGAQRMTEAMPASRLVVVVYISEVPMISPFLAGKCERNQDSADTHQQG